ncbi:EAL domain-containing protein [Brevibacillus humidisoli]|uniref:bifunctional diguanylate cyclase/phosphodiesterase n=1 Tax=Brevibacillus humidisoli TaxID=2895522 RepID=UPI001E51DCCD|nr:EAL domain-containing protein [Brevibacillus humidisoli]UFJ42845.1 EAL domain-containing protein [Brevibacillus humidisoli]
MLSRWFRLLREQPIFLTEKKMRLKSLISQEIARGASVLLFYVDIVKLTEVETRYGDLAAKHLLQRFEKILYAVSRNLFDAAGKLLGVQNLWGDDYAVYVSFPFIKSDEEYRLLSISFQERIENLLNQQSPLFSRGDLRIHIGYAVFPGRDITKEIYTTVRHAVHMAKYGLTSEKYASITQYHRILYEEAIHTVYMPIVSLRDGIPLGWEALARGPEESQFYSPGSLFAYAEETDTVFRLEQICRRRALEHLRYVKPSEKLFINLDPRAIDDPYLLRGNLFKWLDEMGLSPNNIVLEVTERHAITNYRMFRKIIEEYRRKGYLIAVDDAGAGYSSLESIAEIYPDYIKLDMSLIRNIDVDTIKQALLETFVQFADKVKCQIIAEGVETERELQTLIELGVPYAQGYYVGKPVKGLTSTSGAAMNQINQMQEQRQEVYRYQRMYAPQVGEIITKTSCVDCQTKVREVHHIFEQNQRIESIVVLEEDKPIGLVMRFQLYQVLGGQYGIALYYERPVAQMMNRNPLIVKSNENISEVARRAMARETYHLYDVVIIIDDEDRYLGVVSVQALLDKMTTIRLEMATFANPLTGLPGNNAIERELQSRLEGGSEFMVVYCDLDRFKWFNDRYGFEVGDQIIRRTAQLLEQSIHNEGEGSEFIGHIGGDDFILISTSERVEAITEEISRSFPTAFQEIYSKYKRDGQQPPDLSISMAGVLIRPSVDQSVEHISERAAIVKQEAKRRPGTVYVSDRQDHLADAAAPHLDGNQVS